MGTIRMYFDRLGPEPSPKENPRGADKCDVCAAECSVDQIAINIKEAITSLRRE